MHREVNAEKKERTADALALFCQVSDGSAATLKKAEAFAAALPPLPEDPFEAGMAVKKYLIDSGFAYNSRGLLLQDILKRKRGNCLGLSAFIGALLEARGIKPEAYEVIENPRDAVYQLDEKRFREFEHGEHFSYDHPALPDEMTTFHDYRYIPLEHPTPILSGKRLETTHLDKDAIEKPENWTKMQAERIVRIGYRQLCGAVLVDRARLLFDHTDRPYAEVKRILFRGLRLWPGNREGWATAKIMAEANFDDRLREAAVQKYKKIGGTDARYRFTMYEWFGHEEDLDEALRLFPAYMEAYVAKNVDHAASEREARFDFSVAAFCYANSGDLDLRNLYIQYGTHMASWIGKAEYVRLAKRLGLAKHNPWRFAVTMAQVGDPAILAQTIKRNGWPQKPREQLLMALAGRGTDPVFDEKLMELEGKYGQSRGFRQLTG